MCSLIKSPSVFFPEEELMLRAYAIVWVRKWKYRKFNSRVFLIHKYIFILKDLKNVKEHRRKRQSPFFQLLSVCCGFFRPSTDLRLSVCLKIEHFLSLCLNLCNHATCFYNFPPTLSMSERALHVHPHRDASLLSLLRRTLQ